MTSTSRGYSNLSEVTITFQTEYDVADSDAMCLAVSGSIPELGNWSAADCKLATEIPKGSGKWSVSISVPQGQRFYWKWVIVSRDRTKVIRWEHIDNREQNVGNESRIIQASWDEPATVHPQIHHSSTSLVTSALRAVTNVLHNHPFAWCEIL